MQTAIEMLRHYCKSPKTNLSYAFNFETSKKKNPVIYKKKKVLYVQFCFSSLVFNTTSFFFQFKNILIFLFFFTL